MLGIIPAIVIPNIVRFSNHGKGEARDVELHNIQW